MGQRICNDHWKYYGNFKCYLFPCRHLVYLDHLLWRNSRLLSVITCLVKSKAILSVRCRRDITKVFELNWTYTMLHCNFDISFIQLAKRMDAASDKLVYIYLRCLNIWLSTKKNYEIHACYNAMGYRFVKFKHFIRFLNKKIKRLLYVSTLVASVSSRDKQFSLKALLTYFIIKSAIFHTAAHSTN
jgi:hypothetical protein